MTRTFFFALVAITLFSCNSNSVVKDGDLTNIDENKDSSGSYVALKFINDYVKYCDLESLSINDSDWIENNTLLTKSFKVSYNSILDRAEKEDPELGLGFDPVFDAQDFPDNGFDLINWDEGYVTVRGNGKDWKDFTLVLKVVLKDEHYLVDGSGVINIPEDKRAKR